MLVYQATKAEFMDDVDRDLIADHITAAFERRIHRANPREVESKLAQFDAVHVPGAQHR